MKNSIFQLEQLAVLDKNSIPKHVAFMPDGNRRWAKEKQISAAAGHQAGVDILIDIVKASKEIGIKIVTFYTFSTENWSRSVWEVQTLLWLLESYLKNQLQVMLDHNICLQTIGDLSRLPVSLQQTIQAIKAATSSCNGIEMVLAINYGSRDEMRRAVKAMVNDFAEGILKREDITETQISRYLDTAQWPDPDLLIRTSGEKRLSNFMLWQISYSEISLLKTFWPDFTPQHLLEAVVDFQKRERRLGGA